LASKDPHSYISIATQTAAIQREAVEPTFWRLENKAWLQMLHDTIGGRKRSFNSTKINQLAFVLLDAGHLAARHLLHK
jgi:hypothetical protein